MGVLYIAMNRTSTPGQRKVIQHAFVYKRIFFHKSVQGKQLINIGVQ
jgi:hypothetical protein